MGQVTDAEGAGKFAWIEMEVSAECLWRGDVVVAGVAGVDGGVAAKDHSGVDEVLHRGECERERA